MSTISLLDDCVNEAGPGISTPVGGATESSPHTCSMMPPSSQTRSKRSMESASLSTSSTNVTSSLSQSDKRKAKRNRKTKEPTENHLRVRAASDVAAKWELDLERVHGLTDEQACVVMSLMAPYMKKEEFPFPDNPLMLHAKEGWAHMKEVQRLAELYPKCLADQTFVNGEWVML